MSKDRLALFADLSSYNLVSDNVLETKSSKTELYSLEELLDFDLAKESRLGGRLFIQIPFRQNKDSIYASIHKSPAEISIDSCAIIRKYLIEAEDVGDGPVAYVVTMIPEQEDSSDSEKDFLCKPNFSGICLFSKLDGTGVFCQRYVAGQIFKAEFIDTSYQVSGMEYLTLVKPEATKADGTVWLAGSICVGYTPVNLYDYITASYCNGQFGTGSRSDNSGSQGHGTAVDGMDQTHVVSPEDRVFPQPQRCSFRVVSNVGEDKVFNCNGKVYERGTNILVMPMPVAMLDEYPSRYTFSSWVGDFSNQTTDHFNLLVDADYTSIAYYNMGKPCVDKTTGKGNPLMKMSVADPSTWGNYRGGTYGWTRSGGGKFHQGIDLAAEPGTPVYSMFDGEIVYIVNSCTEENKSGFGNEIHVKSPYNGETLIIQYAHLLQNCPIAVDPFNGLNLSVGSHVFQGQLIGYVGATGNAYNVPNKHLHLGIKNPGGKWKDPAPYINGNIDALHQNNIKKGKVDDIKCN